MDALSRGDMREMFFEGSRMQEMNVRSTLKAGTPVLSELSEHTPALQIHLQPRKPSASTSPFALLAPDYITCRGDTFESAWILRWGWFIPQSHFNAKNGQRAGLTPTRMCGMEYSAASSF